ncbi:hypothetical protein [Bradyrhizobium sp. NAS80.1]|uniref:hypothetical protein n=1 Tax=Bradyrhizobium sp. NAS80.1 TaxID=1680159 RepID=UPI001AEF48DF|nr:hypothetical protein [Bradyrhizobium sp. NAS80.1]
MTIAATDHLRAEFNANAWSGRVEGGYRFVAPWGGTALTLMLLRSSRRSILPLLAEQERVNRDFRKN